MSRVQQLPHGWALELTRGVSGDEVLEHRFLQRVGEMYELFCRKQHDYGPNNIALAGMTGVMARVMDKVQRATRIAGGKEPLNEGMRDTLLDLADYGIIALMLWDRVWPKKEAKKETTPEEKLERLKALVHEQGLALDPSQVKEVLYGE